MVAIILGMCITGMVYFNYKILQNEIMLQLVRGYEDDFIKLFNSGFIKLNISVCVYLLITNYALSIREVNGSIIGMSMFTYVFNSIMLLLILQEKDKLLMKCKKNKGD